MAVVRVAAAVALTANATSFLLALLIGLGAAEHVASGLLPAR